MKKQIKIVVITNIPAPYRIVFFNEINKILGDNFLVLYCSNSEPNRQWIVKDINHNHYFLKKSILSSISPYKYLNLDILKMLKEFSPDIVITGGFYPTMIFAILFARIKGIKHIINTDGWYLTEAQFRWYHKVIRKVIYKSTDLFLPISTKGKLTIESYGINEEKIIVLPYVIDNTSYTFTTSVEKKYDLLFAGQFIDRKMPGFFFEVCKNVNKLKKNLRVAIMGDGQLREELINKFKKEKINYKYFGFVQPNEVPKVFCESKLLLFPTLSDGWGVVTNEACAAGIPTITCTNAGAADEIIIDKYNGYILPLDINLWTDYTLKLLLNETLYQEFCSNSLKQSLSFSLEKAVNKFSTAISLVLRSRTK